MFDTNLVIIGNVLTAPEWRRITSTGSLVANFRIASTARRFDREAGRWVDGNSLRVRVTAWRRLAEGVASSITVGDPVVVYGRLYCRDWKDDQGNNRVTYEMEAVSIGHDLARGRAKFFRTKSAQLVSELDTGDAEAYVGGHTSVPLTADEAPIGYGDGVADRFADEDEPSFLDVVEGSDGAVESIGSPVVTGGDGAEAAAERDLAAAVERFVAAQPAAAQPPAAQAATAQAAAGQSAAGQAAAGRRGRRQSGNREPVLA